MSLPQYGGDSLKIGFIGAGRVGFSLGKYFSTKGINVSGYYSKNYNSAKEASIFTSSTAYKTLKDIVLKSNILFITTPDDQIEKIWDDIKHFDLKDKLIIHTSGSLSSNVFSDIKNKGAFGYSIHPMFPFSDKYNSYKQLNNIYFSIEGDKKYANDLKLFLEDLGNNVFFIDSNKKSSYHLASVMVSNLVLALISIGENYLINCGVDEDIALKSLYPLIFENIKNIGDKGILDSITGPVLRGDVGTIKKHMTVLKKEDFEVYKTLSMQLLNLSVKKNAEKNYDNVRRTLNEKNF
ncbi:Rossmann-like and DUF2520 domain-containing protein [Clostridium sp. JN-1]|uniref:Rossmann-like and DUF2520 domain-containing protein n=1 Tax=Clostridium sp. JN-1 TaxID=2483110 RepID=UPI00325AA255